jgi:hypothetical protein
MMPSTPAMAAMMLPGAVAPIVRSARDTSGLRLGGWCAGSILGLMAAFVALDPMSLPLVCAAGAVGAIQKELL